MMSNWYNGQRPITLAIVALGGEGGGVLADWIVAVAEKAGHYAQNTSVAGVAQRTGATVYYVEIFPPGDEPSSSATDARIEPVLSVFPSPGEVDVLIASELMECGRAVQRGFVTPDRTTLITSTNRVYSIDEKMALGDGRADSSELVAAAQRASKRLIAADFMEMAEQGRSVISAALFGALAGSGTLPFSRDQFEAPIHAFGKGVESSLKAFSAGFDAATEQPKPLPRKSNPVPISIGPRPVTPEDRKAEEEARRTAVAATDPSALVGSALKPLAASVLDLPLAARSMILHGLVRTAVYQNLDYAERYLSRVTRFAAVDPDTTGAARLTNEAARHIGLWMCYQDTIQVAMQKTRQARMGRIRAEARAEPNQLVQVREYLHPQIDEITDTMPSRLGARMHRSKWFQRLVGAITHKGMILNTSSVHGYTMLSTMARLRPLRPRSLRFVREQAAIEEWIDHALRAAAVDAELGREIVECQRVLKGYGATYEHGGDSFGKLMSAAHALVGSPGAVTSLAGLREAALADEDGARLDAKLATMELGGSLVEALEATSN
ncbi:MULTISPECIES: indolepyruvate oxidoreductase subunit beta family protein [unclassified Rhodococcus (in: high G+C Gram-positive bacteria)]|uniref:indolepyruvate oxidoreductase subunit beta family protein n=1 Tax=unclassified Rhodococcus (in: high G+C Gram-positive bacteria) TaxID=192944 RepID=UPI0016395B58|nr:MULTISPECIES: indolepyruvate oxidoreductase subunit beta family protein [unclassified Rhodococcus (in: high G+C Gram-positive bacteria)]MBC2642612.1 indolepyruvate oxidoreductase subunit beta family protein [Rhodococcus sp. 3A]MBC2892646.1 indolepyruvate oxidoreductase subunit beta family protein [Rhodococcus sp. 4CII]